MLQNLDPNLILMLAVVGFATLGAWIVRLADELLDRLTPRVKSAWARRQQNRAIARLVKNARPKTREEREAMQNGAHAAIAAFARAEAALLQARRDQLHA